MTASRNECGPNELSDPVSDATLRRAHRIECLERRVRALDIPDPSRGALMSAFNRVDATLDGPVDLIHELVSLFEAQPRKRESTSDIERARRVLGRIDALEFNLRNNGETRLWLVGDIAGMELGTKPITIDALVHVIDGMADCIDEQEKFIERAIYEENDELIEELHRVYDRVGSLQHQLIGAKAENDRLRGERRDLP